MKQDIITGIGLAGFRLGDSWSELEIASSSPIKKNGNWKIANVLDDTVQLLFDENEILIQITALDGYEGKLSGEYYVGEAIAGLFERGWTYSEQLEGFLNNQYPGVILRPNLEDATLQEIQENKAGLFIAEISVLKRMI